MFEKGKILQKFLKKCLTNRVALCIIKPVAEM